MTSDGPPSVIPECALSQAAVGPQIGRYRRLAAHVTQIQRATGEVRVEFDKRLPDGLLAHTLSVEKECCSFVDLAYHPRSRSLTITVANIAHDPRLDSLAMLLTPESEPERRP